MYLWRRPSGWTFQIRIPSSLVSRFGATPLRIRLGAISGLEARHRARVLAGHATTLMMTMTDRKTVSHSLAALAEEMAQLRRDEFSAGVKILAAQSVWRDAEDNHDPLDPAELAAAQRREADHRNFRDSIRSIRNRLAAVGAAIEKDGANWEGERTAYDRMLAVMGSMERVVTPAPQPSSIPAPAATVEVKSEEPGTTRDTLLSVAAAPILKGRREALEAANRKNRYADRLDDTTAAFIDVIGDKPLKSYVPADIQTYANVLGRIPKNRKKYREFDGLSLLEMADKNDKLKTPYERLSETTIQGYLVDFGSVWQGATAAVPDVRNISTGHVTMPRSAAPAIDREGLPVNHINIWLAAAVDRPINQGHFHWMSLVGLITGMRLGELVYLQNTDFVEIDGNLVIDLRKPLVVRGRERARPMKTKTSKRLVAVHQLLHDVGFVEWAKARDGWIFDHLHSAQNPADSAQKRLSYWMHSLGIREIQRGVFHSLRHNAKAWMRPHVGDRTADFQCGHAPSGEGARYGFRILTPAEVRQIEKIPLPEGIDFSPYLSRKR
jgi:integrase